MLTTSFTTFTPPFIEKSDMHHGVTRLALRVPMRATASTEWRKVLSGTSLTTQTTHRLPGTGHVIHHVVCGCSRYHSANPTHPCHGSETPEAGYAPAAAAAARTPALCQ